MGKDVTCCLPTIIGSSPGLIFLLSRTFAIGTTSHVYELLLESRFGWMRHGRGRKVSDLNKGTYSVEVRSRRSRAMVANESDTRLRDVRVICGRLATQLLCRAPIIGLAICARRVRVTRPVARSLPDRLTPASVIVLCFGIEIR